MHGYMFDTNIFNNILDNDFDVNLLLDKKCFATHVQYDEIQATSDAERRFRLASIFSLVTPQDVLTSSFVIGVSRFGRAKLGNGSIYDNLRRRLDRLNKKKQNNSQDALIAETAIANNLTLVTHDRDLYLVTTEFNGSACNLPYILKSS